MDSFKVLINTAVWQNPYWSVSNRHHGICRIRLCYMIPFKAFFHFNLVSFNQLHLQLPEYASIDAVLARYVNLTTVKVIVSTILVQPETFLSPRNLIIIQLTSSAAAFNHSRIVEILLESGADLEAKDMLEMTPLLMAVTHGAVQAAKLLVDHGADTTATDSSLNSALHLAIMYRKPEMVKALLEMDNDRVLVQMKDKDLKTVLHLACGLETSQVFNNYPPKGELKIDEYSSR